jgi:hypothetical protein
MAVTIRRAALHDRLEVSGNVETTLSLPSAGQRFHPGDALKSIISNDVVRGARHWVGGYRAPTRLILVDGDI